MKLNKYYGETQNESFLYLHIKETTSFDMVPCFLMESVSLFPSLYSIVIVLFFQLIFAEISFLSVILIVF